MRENIYVFSITPQPKPRMTQRDRWQSTRTRQADRYMVYKRDLQLLALQNRFHPSNNMRIKFYFPLSSGKQDAALLVHNKRPDIDNIEKGFLDALMEEDCVVWHTDTYKYWTNDIEGRIEVENL